MPIENRSQNVLEVRGLSLDIAGTRIVQALNLAVAPGECLAILGRNGVGKTTLLHALAGLHLEASGNVALCGLDYATLPARQAAQWRGLLTQGHADAFPATVMETALTGRHPHLGRWAWESDADQQIALSALEALGLQSLAGRQVHTLSGGERQRLAIATLLVQDPRLYLLDEPLSHLDLNHQMSVLGLFRQRAINHGVGVVMVLHDVNLAARFCDRVLMLFGDGEWRVDEINSPNTDAFDVDTLGRMYGHPFRCVADGPSRLFVPV